MHYLKTNLNWEDFFLQESLELEEKLPNFDLESMRKSKIRLLLENKILNWAKYESWVLKNLGCASLKNGVKDDILKNFITNSQQAFEIYSNYDFWSEDLLPIFIWQNQLIVFGLHYDANLIKIKEHIFILAPPEVLTYFAKIIINKTDSETDELDELEQSFSKTNSKIEGLDLEIKAPILNFKTFNNKTPQIAQVERNSIWEFMQERHEEYSFEAKKQFSAYVVLKIENNTTYIFKMDNDLAKMALNKNSFNYNLHEDNPFARVFRTGISESFGITQLNLNIENFKYVCVTALKRSFQVVGFLVGFKESQLSENDQNLLEELAKESAA